MKLKIKSVDLNSVEAHALSQYPQECCGFFLGKFAKGAAEVVKAVAADNMLGSPVAFEVHPEFVYQQYKLAEEEGLEIVGIYHSHPNMHAFVSSRDSEFMKYWGHLVWLIIGLSKGRVLERKAFTMKNKNIKEIEVDVL